MTIDEAIEKVHRLRELASIGQQIMIEEAPKDTGYLKAHIEAHPIDDNTWSIGTDVYYAKYVAYGRGPVVPEDRWVMGKDGRMHKHSLRWYAGTDPVFRMYAGPAKANNFAERTAKRLAAYVRQNF